MNAKCDMYPDVCRWLKDFLTSRYQGADVDVFNLSRTMNSRFLSGYGTRGIST